MCKLKFGNEGGFGGGGGRSKKVIMAFSPFE